MTTGCDYGNWYEPDEATRQKQIADLVSEDISWALHISDVLLGRLRDAPKIEYTRRQRLRFWLRDMWYHRPYVHFGPCDHEDCY